MAIQGEQEAIQFTVPRGSGTGELGAPFRVASGPATSAPQDLSLTGAVGITWFTFVPTEDAHIRFGTNASMGNAVAADWPIFKGVEFSRLINLSMDGWFRVIQETNAGFVYYYPSNR